jgi:hypothetical protein
MSIVAIAKPAPLTNKYRHRLASSKRIGLEWIGLEWSGVEWSGLDWIGTERNGSNLSHTHAANVAIHANVVEVELAGFDLAWVFLGNVTEIKDFLLTERSVVIKVDLGINGID